MFLLLSPRSSATFPSENRGKPRFLVLERKIPSVTTRDWRRVSIAKTTKSFCAFNSLFKKNRGGLNSKRFFPNPPSCPTKHQNPKRLFSDFDGWFFFLEKLPWNFLVSTTHSRRPKLYNIIRPVRKTTLT